jgi:hypothetical protein
MGGVVSTAFKGSAYLLGAVTGAALMVPVTAGALSAGAIARITPHPVAIEMMGPPANLRAPVVNRAAKGPRLDSGPAGTPAAVAPAGAATRPVVDSATPAPASPPRVMRTPKGCLSAMGVTKSNLATEELTVCVADASIVNSLN